MLILEVGFILFLSIFTSIVFNHFSTKGIELIRKEIKKITVADSVLFYTPLDRDRVRNTGTPDSVISSDVKIIAPLHERAMRNQDSMSRLNPGNPDPGIKIIGLPQLKRLLDDELGMIIDARNRDEFFKGHILGAKNIPALNAEQYFSELVQIPRDTLLIIYCNGPDCELGMILNNFFRAMEFNNILIYDDGWEGWTEAGMPIDSSESQ